MLLLPFELQLLILDYIKQDNHLDLGPLAQTCTYYATIVGDRFNWKQTVTVLQNKQSSSDYLIYALRHSTLCTRRLQAIVDTPHMVCRILERQKSEKTMNALIVMIPFLSHTDLFNTLSHFPQTSLSHISIRDSMHDGDTIQDQQPILTEFLLRTLYPSQSTLKILDIPSFPSHLLRHALFPAVHSLHIALTGPEQDFWRQFKQMFPNLIELKLTLDKSHVPLFKSLLQDIALFPWIKRLSVTSLESPKHYLSRQELKASLLQLQGLNRITAGWDMIAL
ncbi:hypothetical protein CU098_012928 [Rhizopus stolonifer]|uniref:F-box domain-containing protein n=1 Tax=Rhizopus stolonifer TaxID=4846 RepID=A0A367KQK9_RHIST|nr:hypothetical protein CU098_012928 [Rhizopus stolonifer]